jgi:ATP-dependent DNA helicase RecQ
MNDCTVITMPIRRPNLSLHVTRKHPRQSEEDLVTTIRMSTAQLVLDFCRKREETERIAELLRRNDVTAMTYHSEVDDRAQALEYILSGKIHCHPRIYISSFQQTNKKVSLHHAGTCRVVCATIAFGLGMDLPHIGLIIHWDAADSMLDYVQQTGRGGRGRSPCMCVTMYDRSEAQRRQRYARKASDPNRREYVVRNMQQVRTSLRS